MKAIAIVEKLPLEDPKCFVESELPKPAPIPRDLLVRVRAVSVNPVDYKVRQRRAAAAREPQVLGWDAAGIVEAIGSEVSLFKPGDEVFYAGDITRPGSNAEFQVVDERIVARKPRTLTFAEAAALPLTAITAWEALFDRLNIAPEKKPEHRDSGVLIIGGAGGVGSIAIQIAKSVAGLTVITTALRKESIEWCRSLGADHVIVLQCYCSVFTKQCELQKSGSIPVRATNLNLSQRYQWHFSLSEFSKLQSENNSVLIRRF